MKHSKKIMSAVLAALMLSTFAACGSSDKPATDNSGAAGGDTGDLSGKTITFTMQKYGNDLSETS